MFVYKICDILCLVVRMKLFLSILLIIILAGCQSIEKKADKIGKKEIKEISKFLQQPESELKIEMGEPDEIKYDEKGSKFYIYKKIKYGITCEKKFEIDIGNINLNDNNSTYKYIKPDKIVDIYLPSNPLVVRVMIHIWSPINGIIYGMESAKLGETELKRLDKIHLKAMRKY